MSTLNHAGVKFWVLGGVTIVATASLMTFGYGQSRPWRTEQASQFVAAGEQGSGVTAQLDFRLANFLDSQNQSAALQVAEAELASGEAKAAAKTVNTVITGRQARGLTPSFITTHIRVLLENDQAAAGASIAQTLITYPQLTDSEFIAAAQALSVAEQGTQAATLSSRVTSPEAAERIKAISAGKVTLANELLTSGLPHAAQSILLKLNASASRDLLLGRLLAQSKSVADKTHASNLYSSYLTDQPADITVRLEYADILEQLKKTADAKHQRDLAAKLAAGQP